MFHAELDITEKRIFFAMLPIQSLVIVCKRTRCAETHLGILIYVAFVLYLTLQQVFLHVLNEGANAAHVEEHVFTTENMIFNILLL